MIEKEMFLESHNLAIEDLKDMAEESQDLIQIIKDWMEWSIFCVFFIILNQSCDNVWLSD